jgi:hypothetical protein
VVLFGVVLAALTCSDEFPGISEGRWLVEAMPKGFPHEGPRGSVVRADTGVDVKEQLLPFLRGDTPEKHLEGTSAVEQPTHEAFGVPYRPMGVGDIIGKDSAFKEVEEGRHLVLLVSRWLGGVSPRRACLAGKG